MKLCEVKQYGEPKGDVRWDIDHPKYKKYPELQDAIWDGFKTLPPIVQNKILKHYKLENISLIHFLPLQRLYDLVHDVEYFQTHGANALKPSDFRDDQTHNGTGATDAKLPNLDMTVRQAGLSPKEIKVAQRRIRQGIVPNWLKKQAD